MKLPFSSDEFFAVFARYHEAVWPAPAILGLLAVLAVYLVWRPSRMGDRAISVILALLWSWMGLIYHFTFFRRINPAATLFGGAFVAQAVAFLVFGLRGRLQFRVHGGAVGAAALLLVAFALIVYPLLGRAAGHQYPAAPTFGLPCPTTIFTLGMMLAALPGLPRILLVVPLGWCVVGSVAAVQLGVTQDYGLPVAGLVTLGMALTAPKIPSRTLPAAATQAV